jgi:dTDP-4-dehydrorhamnose reductase
LDFDRPHDVRRLVEWTPELVVNAAAWTDVDGCARDPERAFRINAIGARIVAEAAAKCGAAVIQISTNEVFDGESEKPYTESDRPNPINPYGYSKLKGELFVAEANRRHLIIRTAWLFGPIGVSFATKIRHAADVAASLSKVLQVVNDEFGTPTWVPWLANTITQLEPGGGDILHLAGSPIVSRFEWARTIVALRDPRVQIVPISSTRYDRASRVPLRAVLSTTAARRAGFPPADWREHLSEAIDHE